MKKAIKTFFALLFMVLIVSPGASAPDKKKKPEIMRVDNYIAVFDFEVTTGDKDIARPLTESVRREIVLSGKYKVIDRGNMEKILGEHKLQMSGCVTGECIVETGQLLGVGKLIGGTVSKVGNTYYLTLSLISVKTGQIEDIAEDKCKCELDELLDSTKRLAKKLLGEKFEQPVATAPKPSTVPESKAESIAKAKAEEIARAKTEADELARQKTALEREKQEMAREKQELERQKALDAEREQLATERRKFEAERQQLAMVKRPSQPTTGETARDGRFIAYSDGTVLDTRKNLMWAAKDNGSNINWANAKSYCENYRGGGYTDWRMPTQDELAGLYDNTKTYKSACGYDVHLTELIRLACTWEWASETRGSDAAGFYFYSGLRFWDPQSSGGYRALPVRSGK